MPTSQQRATAPYVQTNQFASPIPTYLFKFHFNITLSSRCRQEVEMGQKRVTSNDKAFILISVADQRDDVRALKPGQSIRLSAIDVDQRIGTTRRSM